MIAHRISFDGLVEHKHNVLALHPGAGEPLAPVDETSDGERLLLEGEREGEAQRQSLPPQAFQLREVCDAVRYVVEQLYDN